ncbi:hypothetical protein V8C34DRAFT_286358 [Trichoderma compactum]
MIRWARRVLQDATGGRRYMRHVWVICMRVRDSVCVCVCVNSFGKPSGGSIASMLLFRFTFASTCNSYPVYSQ